MKLLHTKQLIPSKVVLAQLITRHAGVLSKLFKLKLDEHLEYELKLPQDQSDNDGLVPSFVGFLH